MIKVVAEHHIRKDGIEQFLELTKVVVEKTVKLDEGCVSYSMCQDTEDPLHCSMIEEWESKEALEKHMRSAHFLEIIPKTGEFCEGPVSITLYNKLF